MMNNFADYAEYYNLIYKAKNYIGEVDYVESLWNDYGNTPVKDILEFGCGTGGHAKVLVEKGYQVHGVDLSAEMIGVAQQSKAVGDGFTCVQGDICQVDIGRSFDLVLSLFHVMSYQESNESLFSAFKNARRHLLKDGLFIFDFWYGPAVLSDRPKVCKKSFQNDKMTVHRSSTPHMEVNRNIVEVQFDINIDDALSKERKNLQEQHRMRFMFLPELRFFLEASGFQMLDSFEWQSRKCPSSDSWYVVVVAKAN